MQNIKYTTYNVGFLEVPNETSLIFNISNCPHRCKGCHSKELRENIGTNLTIESLSKILNNYKDMITTVCFLGGDRNIEDLLNLCIFIKSFNLKTCVYTGNTTIDNHKILFDYLDYLKIGEYNCELGGLADKRTNQKFYNIKNNELIDMTHLFQQERIN